jgi:hypothetical protein
MIKGYKELLAEIEIHSNLLEAHRTSYQYYTMIADSWSPSEVGAMSYDGMPKGSSNDLDPAVVFTRAIHYSGRMKEEKEILNQLMTNKQLIDKAINETDIKVKVGMLRAMGLTQEQVAELIERSTRQVQNIERNIKEIRL